MAVDLLLHPALGGKEQHARWQGFDVVPSGRRPVAAVVHADTKHQSITPGRPRVNADIKRMVK